MQASKLARSLSAALAISTLAFNPVMSGLGTTYAYQNINFSQLSPGNTSTLSGGSNYTASGIIFYQASFHRPAEFFAKVSTATSTGSVNDSGWFACDVDSAYFDCDGNIFIPFEIPCTCPTTDCESTGKAGRITWYGQDSITSTPYHIGLTYTYPTMN